MPRLHDPAYTAEIMRRLRQLRPDSARRWGKMSVAQMLWHVNCGLENALGRYEVKEQKLPLPHSVVKFLVLNFPWRKGKTPTAREFLATGKYDFETERARLLRLIDDLCSKSLDDTWGRSSFMGPMTGRDWSRLEARHLDHHLSQFGA